MSKISNVNDILEYYKIQRNNTFEEAVRYAYFAENGKLRTKHQNHIGANVAEKFVEIISSKKNEFEKCNDFDNIYQIVKSKKIDGIGDLAIYDMALAIGMCKGYMPNKVYLHAGPLRAIHKCNVPLKINESISPNELPLFLQNIEPYIVENFLCEYEKEPTEDNLNEYLLK